MRPSSIGSRKRILGLAVSLTLGAMSNRASADDAWTWVGPQTGNWNNSSNWLDTTTSSHGVPGTSFATVDDVTISNVGPYGAQVTLDTNASPETLTLDGAMGTLVLPTLIQNANYNFDAYEQFIGVNASDWGLYNQSNGTNTGHSLSLGGASGSDGQYSQTGGTNSPDILNIGGQAGSLGIYTLNGGTLNVTAQAEEFQPGPTSIGANGTGEFNQGGGTFNAYLLEVGTHGTYTMTAGTINAADRFYADASPTEEIDGTFNQTGGSNLVGSNTTVDVFTIAHPASSSGNYSLGGGATGAILTVQTAFIGDAGQGTMTVSTPSTFTCTSTLTVGNSNGSSGNLILNGGSTTAGPVVLGSSLGSSGSIVISGGSLNAPSETVGASGTGGVSQFSSMNTVNYLASAGGASGAGVYDLSNGRLIVNNQMYVGLEGVGKFVLDGGVGTVGDFFDGYYSGSSGTATLSSGIFTASNAYVGGNNVGSGQGPGVLNVQNTATMTVTGALTIYNTSGTQVNLSGGTLAVGSLNTSGNPSLFLGNGTTTGWTGGTLAVTGPGGLIIGAGGPLGTSPSINSGMTLNVTNTIGVTDVGNLTINGGTVISQADEYATGSNSVASITQFSGSNTVSGTVYLDTSTGMSGSGNGYLQGGTLTTGYQQVGVYGYGYFVEAGGSETINNFLIIGNHAGSFGQFFWNGPGALQITGSAYVGGYLGDGGAGEWVLGGGSATVGGTANLYANSILAIDGGMFSDGGTVNNSNHNVGVEVLGGSANFGPLTGSGNLQVGYTTNTYGVGKATVSALQQNAVSVTKYGSLQITGGSDNNVGSLTIDTAGGVLDITNTHLFINYGSGPDPITSIAAYLASGYSSGAWNGSGINSSTAAVNSANYGIGYADSADPGNPAGLASGMIEIAYTLLGDANLDRTVNGIDFGTLAANFNKSVSRWDQGDFNYDNAVNGVDFAFLAANFNKAASGAAVGPSAISDPALVAFAEANGLMTDVPEPVLVAPLVLTVAGLLARYRRRTN